MSTFYKNLKAKLKKLKKDKPQMFLLSMFAAATLFIILLTVIAIKTKISAVIYSISMGLIFGFLITYLLFRDNYSKVRVGMLGAFSGMGLDSGVMQLNQFNNLELNNSLSTATNFVNYVSTFLSQGLFKILDGINENLTIEVIQTNMTRAIWVSIVIVALGIILEKITRKKPAENT